MRGLHIKKIKISTIFEYCLALFIILDCRSVYTVATSMSLPIEEMVICFCLVILIAKFIRGNGKRLFDRKQLTLIVILLIFCGVFFVFNVMWTSGRSDFLIRFPIFISLLLLCSSVNESEAFMTRILIKYSDVMAILGAISLIFWLCGSTLNILSSTGTLTYYWGIERTANSYFGLYFETNKDSFLFYNLYRNNGIFTEGPMHSLNLSLALAISTFIDKRNLHKTGVIKNLVLILSICSAISVTGIGFIVLIYVIKYLFGTDRRHKAGQTIFAFVLIIVASQVLGQLLDLKSTTNSYSYRIDDYVVGFRAWLDNIIFGGGYGVRTYIDYLSAWRANNTGYSNSFFWILSQGGIWLFLFYFLPSVFEIRLSSRRKDKGELLFLIAVWYLIFTTSFAYQMILILILTRWLWQIFCGQHNGVVE